MENEKQKLEELYWKNNLSSREISRLFGVSHNIVLKRMRKYQISRRPLAREIKNPSFHELTEEKAYIMGVMCGDGCLWKGFTKKKQITKITRQIEHHIRLVAIDKDFVDYFSDCVKKVYGVKPSYKFRKSKNTNWSDTHTVYCRQKSVFTDIESFGTFSTKSWRIPSQLLNSPNKEIVGSFLKGFFDSEGTVCAKRYNRYIRADSTNIKGLREIVYLLSILGIKTTKISKSRNCYHVSISNIDGLEKFYNNIGFSIQRKFKRLESIINEYRAKVIKNMEKNRGVHLGLI